MDRKRDPEQEGVAEFHMRLKLLRVLSTLLISSFVQAQPDDSVQANPQRPNFSTNAFITQYRYLEIETGIVVDNGRFDSPVVLKYAFHLNAEFLLGFSPYQYLLDDRTGGIGDLTFGGKFRIKDELDFSPAVAVMGTVKFPTASEKLGSEEKDYTAALLFSKNIGSWSVDVNTDYSYIGEPETKTFSHHLIGIATVGLGIAEPLRVYGEIYVDRDSDAKESLWQTDWGASYTITPRIVVDFAVNFGLTSNAQNWQIITGVTATLFKL
jgi:hypothetical protein